MTERQEGLLEDFRALRGEMISIFNSRLWGTVTYILIAGGAWAANMDNYQAAKYVFIIFAAVPFLIHTANRERSRIRMAVYIKEIIEKEVPGLHWEHFVMEWRSYDPRGNDQKKSKFKKRIDRWAHIFSLTGVHLGIVLTSLILLYHQPGCIVEIIFGTIGFICCICCIVYFNGIFGNLEKHWRKYLDLVTEVKASLIKKDASLTSNGGSSTG